MYIRLVHPRCIGSIEYIRVDKNDDEQPWELVYGTVALTDVDGDATLYHRHSVNPESKGPGECLSLTGPSRVIVCCDWFTIRVILTVKYRDGVTREIVNGEMTWNPLKRGCSMGKPLRKKVRGEHGSVTVGFSAIRKALSATINVVMMDELPAQIYGTIKAVRFLGESSSTRMLFDKSENECVLVNREESIPLTRPAVFPVPVDSELTIDVALRNHADDQIAMGSLRFTPIMGPQPQAFTVSHFGLARTAIDEGHISTHVMGTFGYLAPKYAMTGHLLVKSDIYRYGVLLLELFAERKPVDCHRPQVKKILLDGLVHFSQA